MIKKLYYNTVGNELLSTLRKLMASEVFAQFRIVGGTALSLQRGHRTSVDIDLFTDDTYGSKDFRVLDNFLQTVFPYVSTNDYAEAGMGKAYFVGENKEKCIKLDIFYTDPFIEPALIVDGIRMASVEDIIAMKMDVISRGGRKKDFWDIHELMNEYSFDAMCALHKKRYPFSHDKKLLKTKFTRFTQADEDFEPLCLRGKHWEVIKLDMIDFVQSSPPLR